MGPVRFGSGSDRFGSHRVGWVPVGSVGRSRFVSFRFVSVPVRFGPVGSGRCGSVRSVGSVRFGRSGPVAYIYHDAFTCEASSAITKVS